MDSGHKCSVPRQRPSSVGFAPSPVGHSDIPCSLKTGLVAEGRVTFRLKLVKPPHYNGALLWQSARQLRGAGADPVSFPLTPTALLVAVTESASCCMAQPLPELSGIVMTGITKMLFSVAFVITQVHQCLCVPVFSSPKFRVSISGRNWVRSSWSIWKKP